MGQNYSPIVQQLLQARMASGRYGSEDEVLAEALHTLDETDAERTAVEQGLAALEQGEQGVPLDEAFESLRKKYQI